MSDRKNIAAWTPPGGTYPPYISINDEGDGTVSVTVRRKADADGGCGNVATIEIPQNAWKDLLRALNGENGQASNVAELRGLLLLERQIAVQQAEEITRLRHLGKVTEQELDEATLARGRLRLWLEFIHLNCPSPEAREFAGQALIGNRVPRAQRDVP